MILILTYAISQISQKTISVPTSGPVIPYGRSQFVADSCPVDPNHNQETQVQHGKASASTGHLDHLHLSFELVQFLDLLHRKGRICQGIVGCLDSR